MNNKTIITILFSLVSMTGQGHRKSVAETILRVQIRNIISIINNKKVNKSLELSDILCIFAAEIEERIIL